MIMKCLEGISSLPQLWNPIDAPSVCPRCEQQILKSGRAVDLPWPYNWEFSLMLCDCGNYSRWRDGSPRF